MSDENPQDATFQGRPVGVKILQVGCVEELTKAYPAKKVVTVMKATREKKMEALRAQLSDGVGAASAVLIPIQMEKMFMFGGYVVNIICKKNAAFANSKQQISILTCVKKNGDNFEILPEIISYTNDNVLETPPFDFVNIVPLGMHNTFFFNFVDALHKKVVAGTFDMSDAVNFTTVLLTGLNVNALDPTYCRLSAVSSFPGGVKIRIFMGGYNNKFTLGSEVGAGLAVLTQEEREEIHRLTQVRMTYFASASSKRKAKAKRSRKEVDDEQALAYYDEDWMEKLRFPPKGLVLHIKELRVGLKGDQDKGLVLLDKIPGTDDKGRKINIWEALALEVPVEDSCEYVRAVVIQILEFNSLDDLINSTKNYMVKKDAYDTKVNDLFFMGIPMGEKICKDRIEKLNTFFKYGRKYFASILAQNDRDQDNTALAAVLLLQGQKIMYNVVTRLMTENVDFLRTQVVENLLEITVDDDGSFMIHLVPTILINLVYFLIYDAYFCYDKSFGETTQFHPWFTNGKWHESIEADGPLTLKQPSLAELTKYFENVDEAELNLEWCQESVWMSKISCNPLPVRIPMEAGMVNFSLVAFKRWNEDVEVQTHYIRSLQGLCRANNRETLIVNFDLDPAHLLSFKIPSNFKDIDNFIKSLIRKVKKNYTSLFVCQKPGKGQWLCRVLQEHRYDIILALIWLGSDKFDDVELFLKDFKSKISDIGEKKSEVDVGMKKGIKASDGVGLSDDDLNCIIAMLHVGIMDQVEKAKGGKMYWVQSSFLGIFEHSEDYEIEFYPQLLWQCNPLSPHHEGYQDHYAPDEDV